MPATTFDAVALLIDDWRTAIDAERLVREIETYLRRNA